ncbi:hypothetical protein ACFQX6_52255 [Streptosporangium lutulentum]
MAQGREARLLGLLRRHDRRRYQSRFDELKAKGFYPIHISAENGIYAAIWTK